MNDGGRAAGFPNSAGLLRDCLIAPAPGWFVGLPDAPTRNAVSENGDESEIFCRKSLLESE